MADSAAAALQVQYKPGVKLVRGFWRPVVNVWCNGRIIGCEVFPQPFPLRADAMQSARMLCDKVETILRAALTPVTVTKQVQVEDNGSETQTL